MTYEEAREITVTKEEATLCYHGDSGEFYNE